MLYCFIFIQVLMYEITEEVYFLFLNMFLKFKNVKNYIVYLYSIY